MTVIDLRFATGFALAPEPGVQTALSNALPAFGAAWNALAAVLPEANLEPLFTGPGGLEVAVLSDLDDAAAMQGSEPLDLLRWFALDCPDDLVDEVLVLVTALPLVEWSGPRPILVPASLRDGTVSWGTNPRVRNSPIRRSPRGVDAVHAWRVDGGTGEGVRVAMIDKGWNLGHQDLLPSRITEHSVHGTPDVEAIKHGTSAAGLIVAADNGVGIVGIAPDAELRLVSVARSTALGSASPENMAKALLVAGHAVGPGGVVLIELGANLLTSTKRVGDVPVECYMPVHDAIRTLTTRLRVSVVEPAGNGAINLDSPPATTVPGLDLTLPSRVDSGAILVGGGEPNIDPVGWRTGDQTSRAGRVDCFADASGTAAPSGPGATDYWEFTGTSCASAVIAGVAVCLQGMSLAASGQTLAPGEVRELLRDRTLGTPVVPGHGGVGAMPDLRRIVRSQRWARIVPPAAVPIDADSVLLAYLDDEDRLVRRQFTFMAGWSESMRVVAAHDDLWPAAPTVLSWFDPDNPGRVVQLALLGGQAGIYRFWWDNRSKEGSMEPVYTSSGDTVAPGTTPAAIIVDDRVLLLGGIAPEARLVVMSCEPPLYEGLSDPRVLDEAARFRRTPGPSVVSTAPGTAEVVAIADHGTLIWYHGTSPLDTGWSAGVVEPTLTSFVPGAGQTTLTVNGEIVVAAVGDQGWLHVVRIDPAAGPVSTAFSAPEVVSVTATLATRGPLALARLANSSADLILVAGVDTEGRLRVASQSAVGGPWTALEPVPASGLVSGLGGVVAVTSPDLQVFLFVVGTDGQLQSTSSRNGVAWSSLQPLPDPGGGGDARPGPLVSLLFSDDLVLIAVAEDRDRISRIRNTPDAAVGKIQQALLTWNPASLPVHGADTQYGSETAAAVARFKTEVLGVPSGQIIDDVGPATVRRLDRIQAASEQPSGTPTALWFTNEYGEPLAGLLVRINTPDALELLTTDVAGRTSLKLEEVGQLEVDAGSALAVVGDLLAREWPPAGGMPDADALITPAAPTMVPVHPGADLQVIVATRAAVTATLAGPMAGTVRVEGRGLTISIGADGIVTLAVQASGGGPSTVLIDPFAPAVASGVLQPELPPGWTPLGTYTVRPGDTADSLAEAFVGDPDAYAEISDHPPVAGELLVLPEVPGWLRLATAPIGMTGPEIWFIVSPDQLVAAMLTDSDPGPLLDVVAVLDRPPAPKPNPLEAGEARVSALYGILVQPGPPIGPDREAEHTV